MGKVKQLIDNSSHAAISTGNAYFQGYLDGFKAHKDQAVFKTLSDVQVKELIADQVLSEVNDILGDEAKTLGE